MILKIDKNCFKDLSKGTHTLKVNFKDGHAEGTFEVDDKITFYIGGELQVPFTATKGQTWADWIASYGMGVTGNNIAWVGFDNRTIFIDPRTNYFDGYYSGYSLGNQSLALQDSDYNGQTISSVIKANEVYRCDICCFDPGTKILMADGTTKNIEDVAIGDQVISYNSETNQFEEDRVTNTITKHNSDDLVFIKLSNGIEIGMRAYHPLLTTDGWKSLRPMLAETVKDIQDEITMLNIGDILIGIDEKPTITEILTRADIPEYDTYNLTVEKNHNYIANGVVAHNAGCKS
jgi:hypothetical protein